MIDPQIDKIAIRLYRVEQKLDLILRVLMITSDRHTAEYIEEMLRVKEINGSKL